VCFLFYFYFILLKCKGFDFQYYIPVVVDDSHVLGFITNPCKFVHLDIGCEKLSDLRQKRNVQMFYTIQQNATPDYISNLIPPRVQTTTIYLL